MSGEHSVQSDEASNIRKILEIPSPNSSSFRSELLSDTGSHKGRRTKKHKPTTSHHHHRSRPNRDRTTDGNALDSKQLVSLLARDEFEILEVRQNLTRTMDRLERETRRADDAENRAREADARILAMELATKNAQAESMRQQEAIRAYQTQLEVARKEILRAQKELDSMAAARDKAEEDAAKDRSKARAIAKEMEVQQAMELGRQEGKIQGFMDGRKEGWYIGTRDGRRDVLKELERQEYDDDAGSYSSGSSGRNGPPLDSVVIPDYNRAASATFGKSATLSNNPPPPATIDFPTPVVNSQVNPAATSTRTGTPHGNHKRSGSGSFTQSIKDRLRRSSDSKPRPASKMSDAAAPSVRTLASSERLADRGRPTQAMSSTLHETGRASPASFNAPPSPRPTQTSPLPSGLIPLQENGRVNLPAPHVIDPPPPSPHSPAAPLPPEIPYNNLLGSGLQSQNGTNNVTPQITVQEPTPPEPSVTMPEPHPAPAPSATEKDGKPSRILARDYAFGARPESPPLPPLPTERGKGKQRQRQVRPRGGGGLHAPGRSSPSDTSTEFSQFEIVTDPGTEQQERNRLAMNGSKLSVIMEGGSTAAESPEPVQYAEPAMGMGHHATPRMGGTSSLSQHAGEMPRPPSKQGIFNDPREYEDIPEAQLSPSQLAQRQAIAEQLRWTPDGGQDTMNGTRNIRDDVSIHSSTTRASAPRRRPQVKMPERLGPSRDVEVLEKQAAMYDAFGTGKFPSFESSPSPEETAVSTRTPPEVRERHRRATSSAKSVPGITIQPPSRPSSKDSKVSTISANLSPHPSPVPMPVPGTPSRRHSIQELPMTPSRIPLPQTTAQAPMTLATPFHGEFTLPAGFLPMQGPPPVVEEVSSGIPSRTPHANVSSLSSKTPRMTSGGLGGPSNFHGYTPAGIPLPLSSATTNRPLSDHAPFAPRGTGRSSHLDLPGVAATSYEPAPLPPGKQYPPSFGPAGVPLPESVAGNSPRASTSHQTPWGGWGNLGAASGPSMPATLSADRPMAMYAGDGGGNKKVSSSSSTFPEKILQESTHPDSAFASADSAIRHETKKVRRRSATIESVTDSDESPRTVATRRARKAARDDSQQ